ncbi:Glycosyltransferase involved in cell wall bisynthesis [Ectothiorhodospira mobilis]|uniref:Glycosyltransferase involved in cell wall bisynthesis n=1 Tax=Ectothiorhodospira mobilis TaxID=195064 RepID=A0A1I4RIP0_ECTMO|nr:glycosyltransferase family 2 protein [Ectothiorhodospira mobilis]SFM52119.1 Glycosyltransferase involved in cell wall bisynthesis [Ectothiorhodospira mobilis]
MKLIVQIPCFNEEESLARTLADIPREIPGIDCVEILIIDDGSSDHTARQAALLGVDHIVAHKQNQGLARAFRTGLEASLQAGADVIVNTDADNQYAGSDIPRLIAPILQGQADMVVGDRQTRQLAHFSGLKKHLQRIGSAMVRQLSGIDMPDAVSGFRAFSREAAIQLNILSSFSYTIETLIQAGKRNLTVASVPVTTRPTERPSRLFRSIPQFIQNSAITMVRTYAMYKPLRVFFYIGLVLILLGAVPILRFLVFYLHGDGSGHIQSLLLGTMLVSMGAFTWLIGLVADLISFNRQLLEMTLERVRRLELDRSSHRSDQD